MNYMPLISIIVPAYNSRNFIEDCIYSATNQTYRNIEIIIVDDGSNDGTLQICQKFGSEIKTISQKNNGRGHARNTGIENSHGEYIVFLDSDDLLLPDSIMQRVKFLETHKDIGWVFADAIEFDDSGDLRLFLNQFQWLDLKSDIFVQLLRGCFPLTSTVMIQRKLLREVGNFNPKLNYCEDLELFLRLSLVSRAGMIDKPLAKRRIHPEQSISNPFHRWNSRINIYKNLGSVIDKLTHYQKRMLENALKESYFRLGEYYWSHCNMELARKNFMSCIGVNKYSPGAFYYYGLSYLPTKFITLIRDLKNFQSQLF